MAFSGSAVPTIETVAALGSGDVMDDPAILIHPTDTSKSVVVSTNKDYEKGGIYVYDLNGNQVAVESIGNAYNNLDLRYNFDLGPNGVMETLIGASGRESGNIHFWGYDFGDPADPMYSAGTIDTGYTTEPYGFTMGRLGDKTYAFVSADDGLQVKQFELDGSTGTVTGTLVRTLEFSGQVEGMIVDDQNGYFYAAEEDGQIERYGTDPASGSMHTTVDQVGGGGNLIADIEGLAIYYGAGANEGYLIASSQGESKYAVYNRTGNNEYLGKFGVGYVGTIDAVTETDGLDVTNVNLGGNFDKGMFVVHDNYNSGANGASNFKFVSWDEVAATGNLLVDTAHDPRGTVTAPLTDRTDPTDLSAPAAPPYFTLVDTPTPTGTSTNKLTGNADDNIITFAGTGPNMSIANAATGNDIIKAGGMTAGDGNDIFQVSTSTPSGSEVHDFTWGKDLIHISDLAAGNSDPWASGVLALVDNADKNVSLMWDADGAAGPGAAKELIEIVGVHVDAGLI